MRQGTRAFVESWLRRRARTAAPELLAQEALEAVWGRARRSLSDLALQALFQNALETATRAHPLLADARVTPLGCELGIGAEAPPADLLAALGGLLVELLTLVEDTSGAILAPALKAELLRVGGARRTPPGGVRPVAAG